MVNLFSPYRHGEYMKFDCKKTSIRLKRLRESKKLSHDKLSDEIEDRYGVHIDKKTLINYEKAETLSLVKSVFGKAKQSAKKSGNRSSTKSLLLLK